MLKNLKTAFAAASLLASLTLPSQAIASYKVVPYIGGGYQVNHVTADDVLDTDYLDTTDNNYSDYFTDSFNRWNFFAGFDLKDSNFSFELGYFKSGEENKTNDDIGTSVDSKLRIVSFDVIYSHKILNHDKFKFLALAGLSKLYFDNTIEILEILKDSAVYSTVYDKEQSYGLNAGAGLEVDITDHLSLRTIAKYSTANNLDAFDKLFSYTAGFKYHF